MPRVGAATYEVLTRLGVEVSFDPAQTCCGQPAFNAGYRAEARAVAEGTLRILEAGLGEADYIVVPSGSCAAMIRKFYPELFADDEALRSRAARVGERVRELSELLSEMGAGGAPAAARPARVTYHDSCHLLRELGVARAPRDLIRSVGGVEFVELERADACCGFGGAFAVKYPEISAALAEEKAARVEQSGAEAVVACDAGCLMQMSGMLARRGSGVRCLHLAEFLAGEREGAAS
jgi:L-lactate dehydrogenase complex protein LldE